MAETTALVLLSFDEREALERLLPRIPLDRFDRVLAIDPGSTDGTLELYHQHGIPVHLQAARGRGHAFQLAERVAGTDRIVFFSTDGNEDPADLPRMLACLDEGYDLVIAGRFILPGACSDYSDDPLRLRKLGNIVYSLIVRLCWRSGVWDSINGYRALRVEAMRRMRLDAPLHEIELQSTIRAAKLGLRIAEFPTREQPRLGGTRKASAATLTLGVRIGGFLLRELLIGRRFAGSS
ncbi:MAG: glycosyltransferase family 2 protein [Candidatus Binatia bacterium]